MVLPVRTTISVTNHSAAKGLAAMPVTMTLTRNGAPVANLPLKSRTITLPAVPAHSTRSGHGRLGVSQTLSAGPGYRVKLCPKPSVLTTLHKTKAPACVQSKSFSLVPPQAPAQNAIAVKAAVGQTTQFPVTIRNLFGGDIGPMTATVTGTGAAAFSLVAGSDRCPRAESDCELKVAFSPTAAGSYNANLTVAITGQPGAAIAVGLTGVGV